MNTPEQTIINFRGQLVNVRIDNAGDDRRFNVFLPGEVGHLVLYLKTDREGNERWFEEGSENTPRADEIGELLEVSDESTKQDPLAPQPNVSKKNYDADDPVKRGQEAIDAAKRTSGKPPEEVEEEERKDAEKWRNEG